MHSNRHARTHKLYKHTCTNITFVALEKKSDHANKETYYEIFNLFQMSIIKIKSVLMRFFLLNKIKYYEIFNLFQNMYF
jgi:hypothetical protein